MANDLVFAGAQSVAFSCDPVEVGLSVLDAVDWAALPAGQLRTTLNRAYANNTDFYNAVVASGLTVEFWVYHGTEADIPAGRYITQGPLQSLRWQLDPATYFPILFVNAEETLPSQREHYVRLQTRYAASE